MRINETYNIHKIINCIFPFFKSKAMCKRGIHNYIINPRRFEIPETIITRHKVIDTTNLKCLCCGKEIEMEE